MGKEKFVRSKPHVNVPDEYDPGLAGVPPGDPVPTESISFVYSKMEFEPREQGLPLAELKAPPVDGNGQTASYAGRDHSQGKPMEQLALGRDGVPGGNTHELEEVSFTYQRIDHEAGDGPSTMAVLEPDDPGGLLVPAVQDLRDATAAMPDPEDLEDQDLDL